MLYKKTTFHTNFLTVLFYASWNNLISEYGKIRFMGKTGLKDENFKLDLMFLNVHS